MPSRRRLPLTVEPDPLLRIMEKILLDNSGCWIFTGAKSTGYGRVKIDGRQFVAHQVTYTAIRGPVPAGLVLDHLCRVRACVNPDHLEVVTHRENILRGEGWCAQQARKTHCVHGHEFTPENTYTYPKSKYRGCRTCGVAACRAYRKNRNSATSDPAKEIAL